MSWDQDDYLGRLKQTLNRFDRDGSALLCDELIAQVQAGTKLEDGIGRKVLATLRRKSYFDQMEKVADALLFTRQDDTQIRRQYAQALIDQNKLTAAVYVLEGLIDRTEGKDPAENAEARGLLGRVYKQLYINATKTDRKAALQPVNRQHLEQALGSYLSVYRSAPQKNLWHGINAVALCWRASEDGVALPELPDFKALAREIQASVENSGPKEKIPAWDLATAAEASLALDEPEDALVWLSRYVRKKDENGIYEADAFELASTRRQLKEVWRLTIDEPPGSILLPLLEAQLLQRTGGRVDLAAEEVKPTIQKIEKAEERAAGDLKFEKVLGKEGVLSLGWYKIGLDRSQGVAKLHNKIGDGFGTGFLIRGGDLLPALGEEILLLTNAHVVSDDPDVQAQYGSLDPSDPKITFEAFPASEGKSYTIAKLLFTSPPNALDATLLRLTPPVPPCQLYPIAKRLPLADGFQKALVIGHPLGGGLSFSLFDSLLLDWDDSKIHYRTPTEPGSSGSPVFNQQWDLIGLHHAGSKTLNKLHGEGTYEANEGIWIQRIIRALGEAGVGA